jgi:hypothetical protein
MSKKDFNKGIKLGLRLSEDIIKGNSEEIKKIYETIEKIGDNTDNIKNIINAVIKTQEENDIEKLFGIVEKLDSIDLEKEEKIILFQILNEIGKIYEPNENQKTFKLNLLRYLGISVNETLEENKINNFKVILENIEKKEEKIIYKLICEYLYLDEFNSLDDHKDILSMFHYAYYFKENIEAEIELKVLLFGIEILYEQFIDFQKLNILDNNSNSLKKENIEVSEDCAGIFFKDTLKQDDNYYIETSNFIVYPIDNKIIALNKVNLKKFEILQSLSIDNTISLFEDKKIASFNNTLYIIEKDNLYYYNLDEFEVILLLNIQEELSNKDYFYDNSKYEAKHILVEDEKIIYKVKDLFCYNLKSKENNIIKEKEISKLNFGNYLLNEQFIYFISKKDILENSTIINFSLKKYNLNSKMTTTIVDSLEMDSSMKILNFSLFEDYLVITCGDNEKKERVSVSLQPLSASLKDFKKSSNSKNIKKESMKYIGNIRKYTINLKNEEIKSFDFTDIPERVELYKDSLIFFVNNNYFSQVNNEIKKNNIFSDNSLIINSNSSNSSLEFEDIFRNIFGGRNGFESFSDSENSIKNSKKEDISYKNFSKFKRIGKWIFDEINNRIIDIEK